MQLYVYEPNMDMRGIVEKITSLIWTRRYWSAGEFKLLAPYSEEHGDLLKIGRLLIMPGDTEAGEIQYINIRKDKQGGEEIEVQGRFITYWLERRIMAGQVIATDNTQNIIKRIVNENVINPANSARKIPGVFLNDDPDAGRENIEYSSEPYSNVMLAVETAAKASKLGFRMITNVREKKHYFSVYAGRDLTADQKENPPCIFSQEFDNIVEQEYTNSVENLRNTAYVGGEELPETPRKVVEIGSGETGLARLEVFVNATDIAQKYMDGETEVTMPEEQYIEMLKQRGAQELEQYAESLAFSSNINIFGNLKYREDYDIGDRVTCVNKRWGIKINVRITEVSEIYQQNEESLSITFGESLPALIDKIRQIAK